MVVFAILRHRDLGRAEKKGTVFTTPLFIVYGHERCGAKRGLDLILIDLPDLRNIRCTARYQIDHSNTEDRMPRRLCEQKFINSLHVRGFVVEDLCPFLLALPSLSFVWFLHSHR